MSITAFHLARLDLPEVRAMAELYPIDQIFDNVAYPTLLANALIDVGIPAFTPEIGAARILDHTMIPLFVEGTMNVLKHHGIVSGPLGRTGRDSGVFVANSGHTILATHGGFVEGVGRTAGKGRRRAKSCNPAQHIRRDRRGIHQWRSRRSLRVSH